MLASIAEVTALTLTCINPLYGLAGVNTCCDVVGVTVCVVPFNSTQVPSTPKIVIPSLIFSGFIFASTPEVTPLTTTGLNP